MPHHDDREMRERARHALSSQIGYLEQLSADRGASNAERLEALRLLADIVRLLDKKPKSPKHHDEHDDRHHHDHHDHDHGPKGHAAKKHGAKHAAKKHAAKKHAKKHGSHAGELARGDDSDAGPRRLAGSAQRPLPPGSQAKRLGP